MRTRLTSDYSPTMKGSREEKQAINARAEMLKIFETAPVVKAKPRRSTWKERMMLKARGFKVK